MKCPFCESVEDKVLESRETEEGRGIRRRRECDSCHERYTTFERIEEKPMMVIKRDGRREQFNQAKMRGGILHACQKRPISVEVVDQLVWEIERTVHREEGREVETQKIGELVMERLSKIDKIAYVRFASVYRKFEHISEFIKEVKEVADKAKV
jgi:transcriptional repressor NrdR